jgi:hypothetical protein
LGLYRKEYVVEFCRSIFEPKDRESRSHGSRGRLQLKTISADCLNVSGIGVNQLNEDSLGVQMDR